MAFHSKKSPSKTDQFAACPGSLALVDALPDYQKNVSGMAAQIGTCVHHLIELSLGQGKEPEAFRDRVIVLDDDDNAKMLTKSGRVPTGAKWFEVDDDMIEGATVMTDYVRRRCRELKIDPMDRESLELESRTNPLPDHPAEETSGSADVTIKAWPRLLEVVDYKNGWNTVEHTGNKQLLSYLLGKAEEDGFSSEEYAITIVQPNAEHEEGKVRTFSATAKTLKAHQAALRGWVAKVDEAANHKLAPKAGFKAVNPKWAALYLSASKPTNDGGKDHCMFCDGKAVCPAYMAMRQDQAQVDFADEPTPLAMPAGIEGVANILAWKPHFDALFRAAVLYGTRTLENGHDVPGFQLSEARTNRRLIDEPKDALATKIAKRFKLKRELLFTTAMKTGPQIEKVIPKAQRKAFNDEFLFKPKGALVIVPASASRDAVKRSASDDFEGVEDDELDFG